MATHGIGQERELKLTGGAADGLKIEVEQAQGLIRELQERIQSDDRVAQLETSLQNVQNRASELEFQLSKSKQVYHLSFDISVIYIS
jgi:predicted RNase H-like nuclease (RuvC/YqgF family)